MERGEELGKGVERGVVSFDGVEVRGEEFGGGEVAGGEAGLHLGEGERVEGGGHRFRLGPTEEQLAKRPSLADCR